MFRSMFIAGVVAVAGSVGVSSAALQTSFSFIPNSSSYSDIPASGTSLIEAGSSMLLSASSTTALAGGGFAVTNDGTVGGIAYAEVPYTLTYVLDTSVNTNGYDITSIATISGWTASRIAQLYSVTYIDINDIEHTIASNVSYNPNAAGSMKVSLTDTTGILAVGAKSISFNISNPGFGTVYQELEVEGSAVAVPEPTSLGILGLGAIALLRRKR